MSPLSGGCGRRVVAAQSHSLDPVPACAGGLLDHRLDVPDRAMDAGPELLDRLEPQQGLQVQPLQNRRTGFVNGDPLARHYLPSSPIEQFQIFLPADRQKAVPPRFVRPIVALA